MRVTPKAKIAIFIIPAVAFILLTSFMWLSRDRSLTRHQTTGVIRIGYAVEAPYAFLKPGGNLTGESPEVARRIVAKLGIDRIEWIQTEFGSLISGLKSGRFDVIAAGMFITPDRAELVAFSEPVFHVTQGMLVPKGNSRRLFSYQQAACDNTIKLAVISGAVEETLLRMTGLNERQIVPVPDARAGLVAVESGLANGLALSSLTINWIEQHLALDKLERVTPFAQPEEAEAKKLGFGGFAFRKEDRKLRSAWNEQLKNYIGSPEHLTLIANYGFTRTELPGPMTTAEVLSTP